MKGKEFYILDTTLRDGEQAAGVAFSNEEKLDIAFKLSEAGVDIIEAGIPSMGRVEMDFIKKLLNSPVKAEILTWNRMVKDDISKSLDCGAKNIHISAPVSDIHIYHKLGKTRAWVLDNMLDSLSYALDNSCEVSIGAEDASRADINFLIKFYKLAKEAGAKRVRFADTLSVLNPLSVYELIRKIRKEVDIEIDFHGHNDFGMATANALAAFKAGAKYISCSVNGLGERAGNTALEEIVMSLIYLENSKSDFKIKKLTDLSKLVEKSSGRKIATSKAIVGADVFSHESGIHVDGLIKDSSTYEVFPPKDLGRKRKIVLGKSSGTSAIINKFSEMGIKLEKEEAREILNLIREHYTKNKAITLKDLYKGGRKI